MFYRSLTRFPTGSVLGSGRVRGFSGGPVVGGSANPIALQMIDYALSLARSTKSDESYAQGMLVLEQCLASSSVMDESDASCANNSKGMVLLAMSDLLHARENYGDAMDKLQRISELTNVSLGVRVAAMEALVGINLQLGNDDASSMLAGECLELAESTRDEGLEKVVARAIGVKGFVELARGNIESAKTIFEKLNMDKVGAFALSYGEFLHVTNNLSDAKDVYKNVVEELSTIKGYTSTNALSACNMERSETLVAAACALGQLQSHLGDFDSAEISLTSALKEAEQSFGPRHPKIGVVLTCLALMFRRKGISGGNSSSLVIQEGLYRRATELLKIPANDSSGAVKKWESSGLKEISAIVRGGHAEVVGLDKNRKTEAERMKKWAEMTWRNSFDVLNSTRMAVIDSRICRAL